MLRIEIFRLKTKFFLFDCQLFQKSVLGDMGTNIFEL